EDDDAHRELRAVDPRVRGDRNSHRRQRRQERTDLEGPEKQLPLRKNEEQDPLPFDHGREQDRADRSDDATAARRARSAAVAGSFGPAPANVRPALAQRRPAPRSGGLEAPQARERAFLLVRHRAWAGRLGPPSASESATRFRVRGATRARRAG